MRSRVNNPKRSNYSYYGGRGIVSEFADFKHFLDVMLQTYIDNFNNGDVDLDRIDVNGNYSPTNCRWVTHKQNCQNQRDRPSQKWFEAVSPTGQVFLSNNQTKFSKENDLNVKIVNSCLKMKKSKCGGWKFKYVDDK